MHAPPSAPSAASAAPAASAPRWQVRLLGGLELSCGAQRHSRLPSRAHVALLARLALAPHRAHAREELVELLWPGVALDTGRNRLRQVLSTLKALLESGGGQGAKPVLEADRSSLRVAEGALSCDVPLFEQSLRAGRLAEAARLYRGELLPGYYDAWIDDERARLAALRDRLPDEVVNAAWPPQAAPTDAAPPAVPGLSPMAEHQWPLYLSSLVGADATLRRLGQWVLAHRLVTVLGPGGGGKTRLAVTLARGWLEGAADLPPAAWDRVHFVAWEACTSTEQALDALLAGAGVPADGGNGLARVQAALAGQRALLVLDNCEQLGAAATLVAPLLAALPRLHVLATARRPLGLAGEREFALPPLPLPPVDDPLGAALDGATADVVQSNPSVALFLDRARAVRADFALTPRNRSAVVHLVQVLEGLPLAIELAAARLRSHGPGDLLQRLQAPGAPHLQWLQRGAGAGGPADARQASMQRVVAWSWQLLSPAAGRMLSALTVLRGSFDAGTCLELCGDRDADPAQLLDELASHSLLRAAGTVDEAPRFALYAPVREFAAERLDAAAGRTARQRLRAWAVHWVEQQPPTPSLPALRADMANLVAALHSAVHDGAPEDAVALLQALRPCLEDVPLPLEGLALAQQAVAQCGDPAMRAVGQSALAPQLYQGGLGEAALAMAEAAVADAAPGLSRARALHALARVRWRARQRAEEVEPLLDEADRLERADPLPSLRASLLALRAYVANAGHRDPVRAEALHVQALAHWQREGNQHAINSGRYNLAVTALRARRLPQALALLAEVLASAMEQHDLHRVSQAANVQGQAQAELRQWSLAADSHRRCLQAAWQTMHRFDLVYGLWNLPRPLAHQRQPQQAVRLMAFAARFWREGFGQLSAEDALDLRRIRRLACVQLGPARVAELWDEGERLSLPEAVALALGGA